MIEPILKTKIIPPRVPNRTVSRDRLLKFLTSNLDKKIISICADAGYGKTTLLAQFVEKLKTPYIWYQLDKSDNDLNLFLRYIIEGMKRYVPDFGKRTLNVINISKGREIKPEILIGTFINELLEIPQQRILLLFDDFHEVCGFKKIVSGFDYLLKHIPTNVSIAISARSDLPFSLERFQLKNEIIDIDQQDLKFTKHEIKSLCQQIGGYIPNQVQLKRLENDSEGWVTCLQFLVRPSEPRPVFAKTKKSLRYRLYDYYDKEVFSSLEQELKLFLVATSVFDYFSPEACDFLLSKNNSKQILKRLEKKHLFISGYDTPKPQYIFHNLFRNFLSKKLKNIGLYQKFHNRAGIYLEKKGSFSSAARHYYDAKNYKSVARLLEKFGDEYITLGRAEIIKPFINSLPKCLINKNPKLIRIKGRIYAWDCDWTDAQFCYSRAKIMAEQQRLHQEVFKTILVQLQLKLNLGKYKGITNQIRGILRYKKLKNRKLKVNFLNYLGIALTFERKIKNAIKVFEDALKISKRMGDNFYIYKILHNLAVNNMEMGNFARAQRYFEELINKLRPNPSPTLILALNNLGHALTLQGKINRLEIILEEALRYGRLFNDKPKLCSSYECLGVGKIFKGELEQADQLLKKAEQMASEIGNNWLLSMIWDGMAVLAINRGNLFEAKKYSDKALELPIPSMHKISNLTTKVMLDLSLKNINEAKKTLNYILPILKESEHLLMSSYLQLARFYLLKKNEMKAKIFLNKSIKLAEKNSYDFLFFDEFKHSLEIIKFVKRLKLKSPYLQHLLLKLPSTEAIDILVEPDIRNYDFIVRLFGEVEIFKRGKEIEKDAWVTKRFQELFSFFMANRAHTLTREKILSVFWPDHGPDKAKQLLYNAVYLIRKTITKNIILVSKGNYTLSPKYNYWIDIEEFEKLISEGDKLLRDVNRAAGLIKYEEAYSLYRGGFMEDYYSNWCQQKRQYYNGLYLYVLRKLARGHYKLGNIEKALKFSNLLINKDPFYEEGHCLAMRCYAALNDLGGLRNCYSNLKKILAQGLRTVPRPETKSLFKTLLEQRKS